MKSSFGIFSTLLVVGLSLASCGDRPSTPLSPSPANSPTTPPEHPIEQPESPGSEVSPEADPTEMAIAPGNYCYGLEDNVTSAVVRLTIAPDWTVNGEVQASIQDYENSYFTAYDQLLVGNLQGGTLDLNVTTDIELDTQQTQETWQISETSLDDGRNTYDRVDCLSLNPTDNVPGDGDTSQNSGLDALGIDPSALTEPIDVQFAPGSNSATLENAVIRGTRDVYQLWAEAGQTMTLNIASAENNAVFDVLSPGDEVMRWEAISEEFVLPETGTYQIFVGGTRGNASYSLDITIR